MHKLFKLFRNHDFVNYYFPDEDTTTEGKNYNNESEILKTLNEADDETNEDDTIDLADKKPVKKEENKEEDTEDDKKDDEEDEDDKDDEDEDSELKDLLDELNDDEDPDEDDLDILPSISRKEILAKYPKFFKDFPQVEKAYYAERKYREIFPSINDAKSAQDASKSLEDFETKILSGDIGSVLSVVKREKPEEFKIIVDNYLGNLAKVDTEAYYHVITGISKDLIFRMAKTAQEENSEELQDAALVLNKFLFGSNTWSPHKPLVNGKKDNGESEEAKKIRVERTELDKAKLDGAVSKVTESSEKLIKKTIEKNIDPKNVMSDYVRRQAVRDAYETADKLMKRDSRFKTILDRAWTKAREKNYDSDSLDVINKMIKSRAATVLPTVIKTARNEALKGLGIRTRSIGNNKNTDNDDDKDEGRSSQNRRPLKERNNNTRQTDNSKGIPRGMSIEKYIMSD